MMTFLRALYRIAQFRIAREYIRMHAEQVDEEFKRLDEEQKGGR